MRIVAGPEPGRVRVRVGGLEPQAGYLRLSVRDTGAGIPKAVAERMFDPFYTTKEAGKGTGLGLAAVQGIVAAHGGALAVDSQLGAGTWFEIFLPLHVATATAGQSPAGGESPPLGTGHILVVDDEPAVGTQLALRLERLGYDVMLCAEPADALEAVQDMAIRFDAVVSDLTMPGMTGIALAQALHAVQPTLPVFLCTGNLEAAEADPRGLADLAGVFTKPVDMAALAAALGRASGRPAVASEAAPEHATFADTGRTTGKM